MKTTTKRRKKTRSITIIGRRWFERTNGNTYFSAEIHVNGEMVHKIDFQYGYGSQYSAEAGRWLAENGYLKMEPCEMLWSHCKDRKIQLIDSVTDVQRKKDL